MDTTTDNLNKTAKRLEGTLQEQLEAHVNTSGLPIHKTIPFNYALSSSDHTAVNGLIVHNKNGFRNGCDVHCGATPAFVCRRLRKAKETPSAAEPVYRAIFKSVTSQIQVTCVTTSATSICLHKFKNKMQTV